MQYGIIAIILGVLYYAYYRIRDVFLSNKVGKDEVILQGEAARIAAQQVKIDQDKKGYDDAISTYNSDTNPGNGNGSGGKR